MQDARRSKVAHSDYSVNYRELNCYLASGRMNSSNTYLSRECNFRGNERENVIFPCNVCIVRRVKYLQSRHAIYVYKFLTKRHIHHVICLNIGANAILAAL